MATDELLQRATEYARRNNLTLREQLGSGVHGIVFVAESQQHPGRSAVKIHERQPAYATEREVYLRLQESGVVQLRECNVPQLLRLDDELWVIEMTIVARPFVLDFAGAYLDRRPQFSAEVWQEWREDKEEQFADLWPKAQSVLRALEQYGIYLADVSPSNLSLR